MSELGSSQRRLSKTARPEFEDRVMAVETEAGTGLGTVWGVSVLDLSCTKGM